MILWHALFYIALFDTAFFDMAREFMVGATGVQE